MGTAQSFSQSYGVLNFLAAWAVGALAPLAFLVLRVSMAKIKESPLSNLRYPRSWAVVSAEVIRSRLTGFLSMMLEYFQVFGDR